MWLPGVSSGSLCRYINATTIEHPVRTHYTSVFFQYNTKGSEIQNFRRVPCKNSFHNDCIAGLLARKDFIPLVKYCVLHITTLSLLILLYLHHLRYAMVSLYEGILYKNTRNSSSHNWTYSNFSFVYMIVKCSEL